MKRQRMLAGSLKAWLIGGLLLGTMAYAIAEDITLTTYYPSPRGVYKELRVTDNVGIGTTSPTVQLQVVGQIKADTLKIGPVPGSEFYVAKIFTDNTSGYPALLVSADGPVLSSSTTYGEAIHAQATKGAGPGMNAAGVVGISRVDLGGQTGGTNIGGAFSANGNTTNIGAWISGPQASNPNDYALYSLSDARSYFAGPIGIGTTSPEDKLHVHDTTNPVLKLSGPSSVAGQLAIGQLAIATQDGWYSNFATPNDLVLRTDRYGEDIIITARNPTGAIRFGTGFDPSLRDTEKMTITSNGNVGIGTTTNPGYKLQVVANGTDAASFDNSGSGRTGIVLNSNLNEQAVITFRENNFSKWQIGKKEGGTNNFFLYDVGHTRHALEISAATGDLALQPGGGNVGIGTASPEATLDVRGLVLAKLGGNGILLEGNSLMFIRDPSGDRAAISIDASDNLWLGSDFAATIFKSAGTERMRISSDGKVGIGTPAPGYPLDVAGSVHATSFPTSSDARLKTGVRPLTHVLDRLTRIRGVSFDWNDTYESMGRSSGHREIGVVAQDLEAVFPELVTTWGDEQYRAVDYGRLTAVLLEAIKEQQRQIETLQRDLEMLKNGDKKEE